MFLMGHGAQEGVVGDAALAQNLRQSRGVTEAIDVEADARKHPKLGFEVALPIKSLTDKGFTAGDVAVRLNPPTADDLPAAFGDALLNLGEHSGVGLFDPLVKGGGTG